MNTPIQQKGRGLQVALCKESTETSNDCLHPDGSKILAYFIEKPNLETNAFRFNSFGILERGLGNLLTNPMTVLIFLFALTWPAEIISYATKPMIALRILKI